MAIAVSTDLVNVNLADATTNYLSLGSPTAGFATALAASPDTYVQSANCVGGRVSNNTNWALTNAAAAIDFSSNGAHIYQWLKSISVPQMDSKANGGLAVSISSDATPTIVGASPTFGPSNGKSWFVGGAEDALAGWVCYVVDPLSTPDASNGTCNTSAIRRIGGREKVVAVVGAGAVRPVNFLLDATRYGTGLTYTGDTSGTPGTMADILGIAANSTNAWGILTQDSNIYFGAGKFNFGTTTQSANTKFDSKGDTFVWRNFPVANTHYQFIVRSSAASTNNTTLTFGSYDSNTGLVSDGTTVKGAGNPTGNTHAVWTLDVGQYGVVSLFGSQFSEMRAATLTQNTTIRGCTFKNFGTITPNGATIVDCTFQDVKNTAPISGQTALIINATTDLAAITVSKFINCNRAIRITANGSYTANGLTFVGNAYDIENTATGNVTIECINSANPATYINTNGGTTNITNPKTLSMSGLVSGSEVYVYLFSDLTELAGNDNVTGTFSWNYNANSANIFITVTKPGYKWLRYDNLQLGSSGITLLVQQQADLGYLNPAGP